MILAAQNSGASTALAAVITLLVIAAYWVPSFVAGARHVPNSGAVIVVNLFLGWTGIGWIVALAMACRSAPRPVPPYGY